MSAGQALAPETFLEPAGSPEDVLIRAARKLIEGCDTRVVKAEDVAWFLCPPLMPDLAETSRRVEQLVKALSVGPPGSCKGRGCRFPVWWVRFKHGGRAGYNADGSPHARNCSLPREGPAERRGGGRR